MFLVASVSSVQFSSVQLASWLVSSVSVSFVFVCIVQKIDQFSRNSMRTVAHGPRKKPLDFSSNPYLITFGLG